MTKSRHSVKNCGGYGDTTIMTKPLTHIEKSKLKWQIHSLLRSHGAVIHRFVALRPVDEIIRLRYDTLDYPPDRGELATNWGAVVVFYEEPRLFLADEPDQVKNLPSYHQLQHLPDDYARQVIAFLTENQGPAPALV